jgi:hypothetical protein
MVDSGMWKDRYRFIGWPGIYLMGRAHRQFSNSSIGALFASFLSERRIDIGSASF